MIKKILIFLLFVTPCFAQEVLTEFNNATIPVLNEELRKISNTIAVLDASSSGTINVSRIGGTGNLSSTIGLNASTLNVGTVPTARLGSGSASSSTFLCGNSTWQSAGNMSYGDTRFKVGAFTVGDRQAVPWTNITGVGFAPSVVIFIWRSNNGNIVGSGIDGGVGGTKFSWIWSANSTYSIAYESIYARYYVGNITAVNSDGFNIQWNPAAGNDDTYVTYAAFR